MKERIPNSPEQREVLPSREVKEHHERLREHHERAAEQLDDRPELLEKAARLEALDKAASAERERAAAAETAPAEQKRRGPITKTELNASFNRSMDHVRKDMSAPSRTFSKVIHTKPIEKTSEVLGATIARPNALLAGAASALFFSTVIYLIAKHYGYALSGFESIGAFILGWIVGLIFDYARVTWIGKRRAE